MITEGVSASVFRGRSPAGDFGACAGSPAAAAFAVAGVAVCATAEASAWAPSSAWESTENTKTIAEIISHATTPTRTHVDRFTFDNPQGGRTILERKGRISQSGIKLYRILGSA